MIVNLTECQGWGMKIGCLSKGAEDMLSGKYLTTRSWLNAAFLNSTSKCTIGSRCKSRQFHHRSSTPWLLTCKIRDFYRLSKVGQSDWKSPCPWFDSGSGHQFCGFRFAKTQKGSRRNSGGSIFQLKIARAPSKHYQFSAPKNQGRKVVIIPWPTIEAT